MALSAIVQADMIVHTVINRQVGSIGPSTTANTGHINVGPSLLVALDSVVIVQLTVIDELSRTNRGYK